jgi:prepilin-type N-terminal cleavage/methylation domain-containing protein
LLHRRLRAFTLIELMIVVGIIAIFSAILVPSFLRARENSRLKSQAPVAQQPAARPTGSPPLLERADLRMTLEVQPLRVGLDVANRYQLEHQGEFLWSAGGPGPRLVMFELPVGVDQVEGLVVEYRQGEEWVEPQNVIYGSDFLAWEAPAEVFPLQTRLAYGARGADRLAYVWPKASKIRQLQATLRMSDQAQAVLPLGSLRPTSQADGRYDWTLQNVLSPAPIEVELSAMDSPLGQAGRLFRLTGLALLLFGAGFWYLAELYRAGSLRDFGFGSFLLLALTYSSFFVSVAVLSLDGRFSTATCLAISMAIGLPLLTFHVSQLVDPRFAISRALPLALVTLSLVLLGVYGGSWRPLGFLSLALLGLGFLTATYRPFRRTLDSRAERQRQALAKACERFAELRKAGRRLEATMLARANAGQANLEESQFGQLQERVRSLRRALDTSPSTTLEGQEWANSSLQQALDLAQETLDQIQEVEQELRRESETANPKTPHCSYCGAAGLGGRYCGDCGTKLPLVKACSGCKSEILVPTHLLPPGQAYHCADCGHRL